MTDADKARILRIAERNRAIVIEANVLSRVSPRIRRIVRNADGIRQEMNRQLSELPAQLLRLIAEQNDKQIIISREGAMYDGKRAFVSVEYLIATPGVLIEEVMHLLDDLLGSGSGRYDERFSDGFSRFPGLLSFALQISQLYERPNRFTPRGADNCHEYFAQGVRTFVYDARSLKAVDAELLAFLRDCILNERFWEDRERC